MNVFRKKLRLLFVCALLIVPSLLSAHPHMFLTSTEEFVWDKASLSGCWIEWSFDQFFSADIIRAYDTDGNGRFSDAETKQVYNGAFINLKNYYYFTFIRQGKKRTNPPSVSKFTAGIRDEKMWYRFFIDLSKAEPGEICLSVYDYTFFCDIRYPDTNPVKLTFDPTLVHPSYQIVENKDYPVYYNPLGAIDDNTIYYTWKKGLQTYYPREIRITYAQ
jgi:ABC-type uncharacterized transport system substrate-binding protein